MFLLAGRFLSQLATPQSQILVPYSVLWYGCKCHTFGSSQSVLVEYAGKTGAGTRPLSSLQASFGHGRGIFGDKSDVCPVHAKNAIVANGHPMGVLPQVPDNMFCFGHGLFTINLSLIHISEPTRP